MLVPTIDSLKFNKTACKGMKGDLPQNGNVKNDSIHQWNLEPLEVQRVTH